MFEFKNIDFSHLYVCCRKTVYLRSAILEEADNLRFNLPFM